ncbi:MAG: ATP-binding protein [Verrucomicrobiota bacterium]
MPSPQTLKPTDLKMLVCHRLSIPIDADMEALYELSEQNDSRYFAVLRGEVPVGLVRRAERPPAAEPAKRGLFQKKSKSEEAAPTTLSEDLIISDPLIIEYGTELDVVFDSAFTRSDARLNEHVILANHDGSYFGLISSTAITRLMHGFVGKHMQELRVQKERIALQHSQVIKVKRDLELTNEKLAISRDQALEGVRMKSQFLANMSHEIRTPMNGVFGMIDLLYDTNLDEEQDQLVTTALSSAETLMRIINDILDFSKIEAGKFTVESMPFNLTEVVESSAALYAESASEKEIDLIVNFDDTPAWVLGDPHRYQQILNNLISNAVKFTDAGMIEVYLTTVEYHDGPAILTEVSDNGIGIPPNKTADLFEPFTQVDGSHVRKYGGTGLGLSICKSLVDILGGEIEHDSPASGGSTFSFVIPFPPHLEEGVQKAHEPIKQKLKCTPEVKGNRKDYSGIHVLLVEDNIVNQQLARRLLLKLNCKVSIADNGKTALEYLRNDTFDCIFMDCQMPVMDGYVATQEIRKGNAGVRCKDIFITAVTAHAMSGDREKCLNVGMNHYFSKPFVFADFRNALELSLQQREVIFAPLHSESSLPSAVISSV